MTASKPIHRRTHVKADGRRLFLYGWRPHTLPLTGELEPGPVPQPHLRWHPLRAEWVGYASHRQERTFKPPAEFCPLCPVQAHGFPGEIPFADFEIAVFENRFPAFHPAAPAPPALPIPTAPATGQCEVVVYSAAHSAGVAGLAPERRELMVRVWADRYRDLLAVPEVAFVMPFENRGEEIGVTLHHPHGQIYAFPFVPPAVAPLVAAFRAGPALTDLRRAIGDAYDIAGNERAVALVPPCARFPSEVWVMPRAVHPGPWSFDDDDVAAFAAVLGEAVARLDGLYGKPMPSLCILYAAPRGEEAHFHFHSHALAVVHSGGAHRLTDGGYRQRRSECEAAAAALKVKSLRDLDRTDLPAVAALPEPLNRRARHVVTENRRVLDGVAALERADAAAFGRLMVESHASQRDDYAVSLPEIDALVDGALRHGAIGARLTGGGFGGCIIALVEDPAAWWPAVAGEHPDARLVYPR